MRLSRLIRMLYPVSAVLLSGVFLLLSCGCVAYNHGYTAFDGSSDKTSFYGFVNQTTVEGLTSSTSMSTNRYSRRVGLKAGESSGDAATIQALTEFLKTAKP